MQISRRVFKLFSLTFSWVVPYGPICAVLSLSALQKKNEKKSKKEDLKTTKPTTRKAAVQQPSDSNQPILS